MIFKKGDRVKFLNDVGGGIVTRVDNKHIYVENEDGFEVPATASQLLKTETTQAEATPFTTVAEQYLANVPAEVFVPTQTETPGYIDLTDDSNESGIDTSVCILLAWVPQRKKNGKTVYDVHLVNDCGYGIMYVTAMITEGAYRGLQAGMLESKTSIHVARIQGEDLKQINSLRLETLFFKKGAYMPQEPMRYELKIDEFYLTDPVNYATNEYFDEKALIYNISEEYLMAEIEGVAYEVQAQFERQKKQADAPKPQPVKKMQDDDKEEVDLHIEQLVDQYKSLTPAEILDIQLGRFGNVLEEAIRNRRKRIVFIHGVGNGRLRLEIHRMLDHKYPKLRYQDASFKEYGYGATMVILR